MGGSGGLKDWKDVVISSETLSGASAGVCGDVGQRRGISGVLDTNKY